MFTHKDIEHKSIFVINCLDQKGLRVKTGELLLVDGNTGKTLTKFPFQKVLAIFVFGHITITSPLIEKCRSNGIFLCVMKPNLRPVFTFGIEAEANYLLRERQWAFPKDDMSIALAIVQNKVCNQIKLLKNTRRNDNLTHEALQSCKQVLDSLTSDLNLEQLMGHEGVAAKSFFRAYYQDFDWNEGRPRAKCDFINVLLDIGYTILFNFIETFVRLFGFDLYVGVYHRTWFKRKSLVCDLIEPFRCLIDSQIRKSLNLKQFSADDFVIHRNEYRLKYEKCGDYYKMFFQRLVTYKKEIFLYMQQYYRAFMSNKQLLPNFEI